MPIRRIARFVIRHPAGTLAALAASGLWGAVAVNALVLQSGPHPAPLLGREEPSPPAAAAPPPAEHPAEDAEHRALVRELQELLAERGFYDGEIDGRSGPLTEEAIRTFEKEAGLEVTGKPRVVLLAHIELSTYRGMPASRAERERETESDETAETNGRPVVSQAPEAPPDPEQTGLPSMSTLSEADIALEGPAQPAEPPPGGDPQVEAVQRVLADLGYAPGPIDGQMGPQTEDAIRRFQSDRDLEPTGELDSRLLRELSQVSGVSLG